MPAPATSRCNWWQPARRRDVTVRTLLVPRTQLVQKVSQRPRRSSRENVFPAAARHLFHQAIARAGMAMRAKRHPAQRHVFALCRLDPVEHRDPFRHAVQRREAFIFEQAGELETVAESERPGDGLGRANRPLGEEHSFDDRACTEPHAWTGGADSDEHTFEHRGSRGPRPGQSWLLSEPVAIGVDPVPLKVS